MPVGVGGPKQRSQQERWSLQYGRARAAYLTLIQRLASWCVCVYLSVGVWVCMQRTTSPDSEPKAVCSCWRDVTTTQRVRVRTCCNADSHPATGSHAQGPHALQLQLALAAEACSVDLVCVGVEGTNNACRV